MPLARDQVIRNPRTSQLRSIRTSNPKSLNNVIRFPNIAPLRRGGNDFITEPSRCYLDRITANIYFQKPATLARWPMSASPHNEHRNFCLLMHDPIGNAAKYRGCQSASPMGTQNNEMCLRLLRRVHNILHGVPCRYNCF